MIYIQFPIQNQIAMVIFFLEAHAKLYGDKHAKLKEMQSEC